MLAKKRVGAPASWMPACMALMTPRVHSLTKESVGEQPVGQQAAAAVRSAAAAVGLVGGDA
eukprot:14164392-Alexandrium_andersonii.AAC.1